MINANESPQTIFQTLCLSGKYGHEQEAETKEAGPGSLPLCLSKQNSFLPFNWLVQVSHTVTVDSTHSLAYFVVQFLMFSFFHLSEPYFKSHFQF